MASKHQAFIRTLPCVICGDSIQTQCAHVRFNEPRLAHQQAKGKKPPDWFCAPLCNQHHRVQHEQDERDFWDWWGIDIHFVTLALYCNTGNYFLCCQIIEWHQYHSQRCLDLKIGISERQLKPKGNILE
jgi:hypothetical protein